MAPRLKHETRISLLTLLSGAPAVALSIWLLWRVEFSNATRLLLVVVIVCIWWGFSYAVRERVMRPLQTASNLLSALREEDYSVRARSPRRDDALGELMAEVNTLSQTLREQRLGALEASALLRTVMAEIDVAIFTFDDTQRLQLVNRAGERLLARPGEQLLGRTARELGLEELLNGESARTAQVNLPGSTGRWGLRRGAFRQEGRPHQLLVMTDLSRALRDEERQAWQRIVRVIGHELNNSLAPIKSIAGTLGNMVADSQRADEEDLRNGLAVIASRADSLSRFMQAYARLARLPAPCLKPVDVSAWIQRAAKLETRLQIKVAAGPALTIQADDDQLEQLLINLIRNAVEATLEVHESGGIRVSWSKASGTLEVRVQDCGPGLSNSANLFVPFFTTKPEGSGIGLVLCRQIAEAHRGSITLENRTDRRGCEAILRLPLG